ncbi:MAG: PAS/PAC sensor protein [bacterium]|nr:MAG: PAS/PAC sensor protein [bacterium]
MKTGTFKPTQDTADTDTLVRRGSLTDPAGDGSGEEVYAFALPVAGTPWHLVYERSAADVNAPVLPLRLVAAALVLLLTGIAAVLMLALWWRQSLQDGQAMTEQYRALAGQVHAQRRLLTSVNDTMAEQITVTDASGRLAYVNQAFATFAGHTVETCLKSRLDELLPRVIAKTNTVWDRRILSGATTQIDGVAQVPGGEGMRWFAISKVPFPDEAGRPHGVVTVTRDITAHKQQQERRERVLKATVRTLARSVAVVDPYLADHSRHMETLAVAVARTMGAGEEDVQTLEIASHLSQIGKIFLPREIVSSPDRLSPAERQELERHVTFALDVLKDLDFGLPVMEAVGQMHERLDGSGYPNQLSNGQIGLLGRILAVVDVFAARTEPRSYREAAEPRMALDMLK